MATSGAPGARPAGSRQRALLGWVEQKRRHAHEILHEEGARVFVRRAARKALSLVYCRVELIYLELREPVREPQLADGIAIRLLERNETEAYVRMRPKTPLTEVLRRLDAGESCFSAWAADRLASVGWVAFGETSIDPIGIQLALSTGDACGYDSYTDPEYRRQGLATAIDAVVPNHLRRKGCRRLLVFLLPESPAARGPGLKLGYQQLATVGYIGIGPVRVRFARPRSGRSFLVRRGEPVLSSRLPSPSAGDRRR